MIQFGEWCSLEVLISTPAAYTTNDPWDDCRFTYMTWPKFYGKLQGKSAPDTYGAFMVFIYPRYFNGTIVYLPTWKPHKSTWNYQVNLLPCPHHLGARNRRRWSLMKFTTWLLKVTRKLFFEIENLKNGGAYSQVNQDSNGNFHQFHGIYQERWGFSHGYVS